MSPIIGYFDFDFWRVFALQHSEQVPAVKHALAAISSLHESLQLSRQSTSPVAKALHLWRYGIQQCNLALFLLRKSAMCDSWLILTSASVIFFTFEVLAGLSYSDDTWLRSSWIVDHAKDQFGSAKGHIANGLRLLDYIDAMEDDDASLPAFQRRLVEAQVIPVLRRLDVRNDVYSQSDIVFHRPPGLPPQQLFYSAPTIPEIFSGLLEAHQDLGLILRWIYCSLQELVDLKDIRCQVTVAELYQNKLEEWHRSHLAMIQRAIAGRAEACSEFLQVAALDEANLLAMQLTLKASCFGTDGDYTEMGGEFEAIMRCCRTYLSSRDIHDISAKAPIMLNVDAVILHPLLMVAYHSTDERLKADAIQTLRRMRSIAGLSNFATAAYVAEVKNNLENRCLEIGPSSDQDAGRNNIRIGEWIHNRATKELQIPYRHQRQRLTKYLLKVPYDPACEPTICLRGPLPDTNIVPVKQGPWGDSSLKHAKTSTRTIMGAEPSQLNDLVSIDTLVVDRHPCTLPPPIQNLDRALEVYRELLRDELNTNVLSEGK